jgi:TfoX/Sxy family transcriptional regulator of competence genes
MAFEVRLAERVRDVLADVPGVEERQMFGGLAFLVEGHMACGIVRDLLMARLGEAGAAAALDQPHVRPMDFTGRPMTTMVYVEPEGVATDAALRAWVDPCVAYVRSLPPKRPKRRDSGRRPPG